eukprot:SAG11_NODE_25771_length_354_cov_0.807843_2_plen_47_part_01
MIRGAACNAWDQGVDGLLLNQWFYNWPCKDQLHGQDTSLLQHESYRV